MPALLFTWGPDCERGSRHHGTKSCGIYSAGDLPRLRDDLITIWLTRESLEETAHFFLSSTFLDDGFARAGRSQAAIITIGADAETYTGLER